VPNRSAKRGEKKSERLARRGKEKKGRKKINCGLSLISARFQRGKKENDPTLKKGRKEKKLFFRKKGTFAKKKKR